jgi:hypothetical protein
MLRDSATSECSFSRRRQPLDSPTSDRSSEKLLFLPDPAVALTQRSTPAGGRRTAPVCCSLTQAVANSVEASGVARRPRSQRPSKKSNAIGRGRQSLAQWRSCVVAETRVAPDPCPSGSERQPLALIEALRSEKAHHRGHS